LGEEVIQSEGVDILSLKAHDLVRVNLGRAGVNINFLKSDMPSTEEIAAAATAASKWGVSVYLRGTKGLRSLQTKGYDALFDGAPWEIKTPESPTVRAIQRNIYEGAKQASRVLLDIRKACTKWSDVVRGSQKAIDEGAKPVRVDVIDEEGNVRTVIEDGELVVPEEVIVP